MIGNLIYSPDLSILKQYAIISDRQLMPMYRYGHARYLQPTTCCTNPVGYADT